MNIWTFIQSTLKDGQNVALLYVLDNAGSSPGREGFMMAVANDGTFVGTIGGGIMEVKLLELAKNKLKKQDKKILIKQQFHDKKHAMNQSGLICSGEQTVAIIPLSTNDLMWVEKIIKAKGQELKIGLLEASIELFDKSKSAVYQGVISLNSPKRVHILGGGHVGLALSQVLSLLDYYVIIYDDRADLNTLKQNHFADEIHIINYKKADKLIDIKKADSLIFVTFSYRSDKLLLKQFYKNRCLYMGMMGSDAKIKTLYEELEKEGISKAELAHIFAPIGLPIFSKTTMEIAVSIAGQMILEHNKHLPTGRQR